MVEFFFLDAPRMDEAAFAKVVGNDPLGRSMLGGAVERFAETQWDAASLHEATTQLGEALGLTLRKPRPRSVARSPARWSVRRSSSRCTCSGASARWRGCAAHWRDRRRDLRSDQADTADHQRVLLAGARLLRHHVRPDLVDRARALERPRPGHPRLRHGRGLQPAVARARGPSQPGARPLRAPPRPVDRRHRRQATRRQVHEAWVSAKYLEAHGVAASHILQGSGSDTWQNVSTCCPC